MQQQRVGRRGASAEAAATSLEFVGAAVAAALLVGGAAATLHARAPALAHSIGGVLAEVVEHGSSKRRVRGAREVRTGGGDVRVRVSRDEIRMTPVLDPKAAWHDERTGSASWAGFDADASVSTCAMCASADWDHGVELEHGGLLASIEGSARLALASVQAQLGVRRELGTIGSIEAAARGRAMVGVEARGDGELHLGRDGVDAELQAGAMAGAVARGEVHAGLELFGVALEQSGAAEGWAGAGAKGSIGLHAGNGRLQWRMGWGAALGLGGAAEWSGSVDVSKVPAKHRRLARDALHAAVVMTRVAVPVIR